MEEARELKNPIIDRFLHDHYFEKACRCLDEGFEDAMQYVVGCGRSRMRSTNLLERLNQELRRREKVVRIFPNIASAIDSLGAC